MVEAHNLGAQVPNERLIEYAVEVSADAILVAGGHPEGLHVRNLTELIELLEAKGLRERLSWPAARASATSLRWSSATTPASAGAPTPSTLPPSSSKSSGSGLDFLFYSAPLRIEPWPWPSSRIEIEKDEKGEEKRDRSGHLTVPHESRAGGASHGGSCARATRIGSTARAAGASANSSHCSSNTCARLIRRPARGSRAGPRTCSGARSRDAPPPPAQTLGEVKRARDRR